MANEARSGHPPSERAFARNFCRMWRPASDRGISSYVFGVVGVGAWLYILVGATIAKPLFGLTLTLAVFWKIRHAHRWDGELRALARRRRSWPLDIRKRLNRDGLYFIRWDYWRIIDISELRELRKDFRTDELIQLLLVPPIVIFAGLLQVLGEFVMGKLAFW